MTFAGFAGGYVYSAKTGSGVSSSEIDVLLASPLADLRGYQLHLAALGGSCGDLELGDIIVELAGKSIENIYDYGVTAGKGAKTTYKPFDNVTRGEMAVFMATAMSQISARPSRLQAEKISGFWVCPSMAAKSRRSVKAGLMPLLFGSTPPVMPMVMAKSILGR